jgi:predicted GNAT superfamily acetyltransferase
MPTAQIRPLAGDSEYRECERIQKSVWGAHAVSSELLSVTQKYGGAVLGAVIRGKIVGFLYAFLARRHGRLVHWSHMMAVEPEYRDQGLGFRMKLAHRELALKQRLSSICWTFDPLQSRNATLNIARLGGRTDEYILDCYGQFPSLIEKGLPSDRFAVEWRIASAAVERRLLKGASGRGGFPVLPRLNSLPRVNEAHRGLGDFLENRRITLNLRDPRLLVEIPSNTAAMRKEALSLAKRWRMETRKIFTRYLSEGCFVEEFIPPGTETDGRCFYVLRRTRGR